MDDFLVNTIAVVPVRASFLLVAAVLLKFLGLVLGDLMYNFKIINKASE